MKISRFTVFGERCSGTNHATAWLEANTGLAFTKEFGWKHGMMPVKELQKARDTLCVLVVRNLPDWLRSLHLKPHHLSHKMRGLPFEAFISRRVETILDHNMGVSIRDRRFGSLMESEQHRGKPYANLLRLRRHKYRQWLRDLAGLPHGLLLRHEDLVGKPDMVLGRVAEICGIPVGSSIHAVKHYKGKEDAGEFHPKGYMNISAEAMAYILEQVDWEIEEQLGYDTRSDLMACRAPEVKVDMARLGEALVGQPELWCACTAHLAEMETRIGALQALLDYERKYMEKVIHAVKNPPARWRLWPKRPGPVDKLSS